MSQKSTFNKEDADAICAGMAEGRSLLSICEERGIAYTTARRWEVDNEEHAANSMRARELGCHYLAEQCLDISDDGRNDWIERHDKDGQGAGWAVNGENVQRSRLRIDTRMRLIGKWLPKIYGDKLELGGELTHKKAAADMTDDELLALVRGKKRDT